MTELDSKTKKQLRGQAQKLPVLFKIGKNGLTEGLIQNIKQAFTSHSLIKIKFEDFKEGTFPTYRHRDRLPLDRNSGTYLDFLFFYCGNRLILG